MSQNKFLVFQGFQGAMETLIAIITHLYNCVYVDQLLLNHQSAHTRDH